MIHWIYDTQKIKGELTQNIMLEKYWNNHFLQNWFAHNKWPRFLRTLTGVSQCSLVSATCLAIAKFHGAAAELSSTATVSPKNKDVQKWIFSRFCPPPKRNPNRFFSFLMKQNICYLHFFLISEFPGLSEISVEIQQKSIFTRLVCFYVTAILSWG